MVLPRTITLPICRMLLIEGIELPLALYYIDAAGESSSVLSLVSSRYLHNLSNYYTGIL